MKVIGAILGVVGLLLSASGMAGIAPAWASILGLVVTGLGLGAVFSSKTPPVVVDNKSKIERVKLDEVVKDMTNLDKELKHKLEKADEESNNITPPTISDINDELERIRARRRKRTK